MTKITFEEWRKNYKDIPFLEENHKELIFLKEKLTKQFYSQGGKEVFI